MRRWLKLSAIGLVVVSHACRDEVRSLITAPLQTGETNSVVYLTVSDQAPLVGGMVTVTANVARARRATAVGSFAGHVRYDPGGLVFVAGSRLPSGMRAFNPQPGHIRVAGAAAEGFQDGRLFALTFKVNDPRALRTIELALDEINGTDFGNHLPADRLKRTVRLRSPED